MNMGMGWHGDCDCCGPVGILYGLLNVCQIKRKLVKQAINIIVDV